jgi:hypothetical protein
MMHNQSITDQHRSAQAAPGEHGRDIAQSRPKEFTLITLGLAVLVILHLIVPLIMMLERDTIAEGIRQANRALTPDAVDLALKITLLASALFHLLFVGLYIWFGLKLQPGRRWARIALTATLIIAVFTSVVSFKSSPLFRAIIPISDLLQLALVVLLWLPRTMRDFFATAGRAAS